MKSDTLVIGIGNPYRSDDAIGWMVIDELVEYYREAADLLKHDGEPASLIASWEGRHRVLLIDAVISDAPPGTIHRIDINKQALPSLNSQYSSHSLGIQEAVELARILGKLPPSIEFLGIEGKNFQLDNALSEVLQEAKMRLVQAALESLGLPRAK